MYRLSSLSGPPSILYTTEYIIHQASEFGQAGQLTCAVNTSPDTESHVTWWVNGEAIQDGAKYSRSVSSSNEEVMLFHLHVADIQQSDIGSFLCQLSSDYSREDSQDAWIQVDYRKGTCVCYQRSYIPYSGFLRGKNSTNCLKIDFCEIRSRICGIPVH